MFDARIVLETRVFHPVLGRKMPILCHNSSKTEQKNDRIRARKIARDRLNQGRQKPHP
jgi:hypothetical protein